MLRREVLPIKRSGYASPKTIVKTFPLRCGKIGTIEDRSYLLRQRARIDTIDRFQTIREVTKG